MTPSERLKKVANDIRRFHPSGSAFRIIDFVLDQAKELESIAVELEKAPQGGVAVGVCERLSKYSDHTESCNRTNLSGKNCICGYDEAIAAYRSARDAAKGEQP